MRREDERTHSTRLNSYSVQRSSRHPSYRLRLSVCSSTGKSSHDSVRSLLASAERSPAPDAVEHPAASQAAERAAVQHDQIAGTRIGAHDKGVEQHAEGQGEAKLLHPHQRPRQQRRRTFPP